jgi:hypothetical protein
MDFGMAKRKVNGPTEKSQTHYWVPARPNDQDCLAWIIDFIQRDLGSIDIGEILTTYIQMEEYIFKRRLVPEDEARDKETGILVSYDPVDVAKLFDQTKPMFSINLELKNFFLTHIWPLFESGKEIRLKFDEIKETPKEQRDYTALAVWFNQVLHKASVRLHEHKVISVISLDIRGERIAVSQEIAEGEIKKAIEELVRLIAGLNYNAIAQCEDEECKRFFLNPTKRQKRFCSTKCNWRFNARKRREDDSDAYREKQREIMWERYPDKVRKEVGPNVIVKRRKHYDTEKRKKK